MAGKQYPAYFEVFVNGDQRGPVYTTEKAAMKAAAKHVPKRRFVSVVITSEDPEGVPMAVARWENGERL